LAGFVQAHPGVLVGDLVIREDDLAFGLVAPDDKPFGGDAERSAGKESGGGNQSKSRGGGRRCPHRHHRSCGFLATTHLRGHGYGGTNFLLLTQDMTADPAKTIPAFIDFAA
jgi:hypothetical protein